MTLNPVDPRRVVVALSDLEWLNFRELVRRASGISVPEGRRGDLAAALAATAAEARMPTLEALARRLHSASLRDPLVDSLVARMTVTDTHFFRDAAYFRALEERVLPELIERNVGAKRLRAWSAGCASGEEAYSLAMLLRKVLGPEEAASWTIDITGSDINEEALARAREARYGGWSFHDVPADVRRAFFVPALDGRLEVIPAIRRMVRFTRINLVEPTWPSAGNRTSDCDLVLCRNVLCYLDPAYVEDVVARLYRALRPGGWLVVGAGEGRQRTLPAFEPRIVDGAVVHQRTDRVTAFLPREPRRSVAPPPPAGPHRVTRPAGLPDGPTLSPIRLQPDERTATTVLGKAREHVKRREFAQAERWIAEALRLDPACGYAHYLTGVLRQEEGRLDDAILALRRATTLQADDTLAHFALASVLARMGQADRARSELAIVEELLEHRAPGEKVAPGEDMTVARLRAFVSAQRHYVLSSD